MKKVSLKRIFITVIAILLASATVVFILRLFKVPVLPNYYCAIYKYGYTQKGEFNDFCPPGCVIKEVFSECPKGAWCGIPIGEGDRKCVGF